MGYLSPGNGIFSLIFADPPYEFGRIAGLPGMILSAGMLAPDGYLIVEHRRGTDFTGLPAGYASFQRAFGATEVTFFHRPEDNA